MCILAKNLNIMNHFKEINDLYKDLISKYPKLTLYEALDIASKIQNCYAMDNIATAINSGLNVGKDYPTSLEAIAIKLGYGRDNYHGSILEAIDKISEKE